MSEHGTSSSEHEPEGDGVVQPRGKRDLISIDDLSNAEILALFRFADEFDRDLRAWADLCPGYILATLFFEPSTRTRLSFESAMHRLGGGVISATDGESTSATKGESLADTARVVGGRYADIIVLRHAHEGAARVAASYADVPVVNAGDGGHEHPTQTLCDLYTLWREKGKLQGLEVALSGDLRYSRTIHSLAYALARFGASLVLAPFPGMEIPKHVLERLQSEWHAQVQPAHADALSKLTQGKDAVYVTPGKPHQQTLFTRLSEHEVEKLDAIYMTRSQRERHGDAQFDHTDYPSLGPEQLRAAGLKETRVMHPLPRVDEISYELDRDPRAIYFRQAGYGVPIRMALLAFLLGQIELEAAPPPVRGERHVLRSSKGVRCRNPRCISNGEGRRYLLPDFELLQEVPPRLRCRFCAWDVEASHVGHVDSRKLHRANAAESRRIKLENRVYFESREQAEAQGFGA
ncbi:MAG: aspartate carbamoyltransferase catalytic subunit [Planctomycetota bacterium]|nr:MAG: aspartate carbamoyltransferase catalytic subunit [Planctomycetota bacterium]